MFKPKRRKVEKQEIPGSQELSDEQNSSAGFSVAQDPGNFRNQVLGGVFNSNVQHVIAKDGELILPGSNAREPFLASPPPRLINHYFGFPSLKSQKNALYDRDAAGERGLGASFESQRSYNCTANGKDENLIGNSGFIGDTDSD